MNKSVLVLFSLLPVLSSAAEPQASAVATFESLGLYYNHVGREAKCPVRYRVAGSAEWREGYPLVYDQRERQYRGSLVGLTPDTLYNIRLEPGGAPVEIEARTLSEKFPVGKTTHLAGGTTDQTLYVREGGAAAGWHLITPTPGTKFVSDVFNLSDYNVVVEADYVILRGLDLRNAGIHGVLVGRACSTLPSRIRASPDGEELAARASGVSFMGRIAAFTPKPTRAIW